MITTAVDEAHEPEHVAPAEGPPGRVTTTVVRRRSRLGRLTWAIGCVAIVLATDFGTGWLWDRAFPADPPPAPAAAPAGGTAATSTEETALPPDPRAALPAMADYPWRDAYFDAIRRTPAAYWPYTEYRPEDFTSPYVNQRGWTRLSYEPGGDPGDMPTVWMFGGSTTWGEGQRDEYTIASQLARVAEAEGLPFLVQNYGTRGWVHFQEMILFEQQLASETPPDLALFYDGANEISAQSMVTESAPAHTLTYDYAERLYGLALAVGAVDPGAAEPTATAGEVYEAYAEHSAVHKIVDLVRSRPADASPVRSGDAPAGDVPTGIDPDAASDSGGTVEEYIQDGRDAAAVYERGKDLTQHLAETHHVDLLLFWQPIRYGRIPPVQAAIDGLSGSTIDISDALDGHEEVYIDGGHTNEEGARIVAERIWKDLRPKVRAWYEAHG